MNKKLGMAVAGAVMAFGASAANAGITIPAGDWTIDIGGNVNAYYTNTNFSGNLANSTNAADGEPLSENANQISTGLLPSALGIGGKTRQNDLDIAFQFTFFTGVNSAGGIGSSSGIVNGNGADGGSLNIRQTYMTFGDASWGSIKMGRDLGVFGSDAILSDMTLLGVGGGAGGAGNTTLGRIGIGYLYADWVGQIQYSSPNWNGFSFAVAAREPWGNSDNSDLGFDGKVSYEWAGDVAGKVWAGYIHQKVDALNATLAGVTVVGTGAAHNEQTAQAWEIGGKVKFSGLELVGYYYDGENMGLPGLLVSGFTSGTGLTINALGNKDHDVNGGYVQATYVLPNVGTKLGLSYGISTYEKNSLDGAGADDYESKAWVVGAYHPLTKSLNLVAEYTDAEYENNFLVKGADLDARTIALGAILFF